MNIDRGQSSFEPEEIKELQRRLLDYKQYEGLSWDALGKKVNVPGGTLGPWSNAKYAGDVAAVAYKVNRFFLSEAAREDLERAAPIVPGFQWTKTSRMITSQLRWAHRGKFVIAVGTAGIGKTATIDQYCATTPNAFKATMSPATKSVSAMLLEILMALGVTTRTTGSRQVLTHIIQDRLTDVPALLVIDEAQHLDDEALEQLRAIFDKLPMFGVLLSGNPEVLTRIQGGSRQAAFAQLYSRVSYPHVYIRPEEEDVDVILAAWGVTHAKEIEFCRKVASLPGCLRSITMTLELATLVSSGADEARCLTHIQDAWAQHSRQPIN